MENSLSGRAFTKTGYHDNGAYLCTMEWLMSRTNSFPFDDGSVEVALPPLSNVMVAHIELTMRERFGAAWHLLRHGFLDIEVQE